MKTTSSPTVVGASTPMPKVVTLMAGAAGLVGANVHYSQPLLPLIAVSLSVAPTTLGVLPAVTQFGFAIGLLAILPLADALDRKRIILITTAIAALALVAEANAPTLPLLLLAALVVGAASVAPQILSPFAASVAPPGREGQASGMVLSGILLGVLLSKVLAGVVAAFAGWRWLFDGASVAMVIIVIVLWRVLPQSERGTPPRFMDVLTSPIVLLRQHPALRVHALLGALVSAAFMLFWSSYALHLYEQFKFGALVAGLFGIAGIAGSLLAPLAGRAVDRGRVIISLSVATIMIAGAFVLMLTTSASVIGLVIGILILDGGVGIAHSTNQARVFRLDPAKRSRLNSVYMFSYFIGGAVGSIAAAATFTAWNWLGVCVAGMAIGVIALAVALLNRGIMMRAPEV
jgi:predicted MFS family arabinose efflux permease